MIVALVIAAIAGLCIPHALRLRHIGPTTAVVIWLSALTLRALAVVLAASWLLLFFPATQLFAVVTHWCWHHLASATLDGHDVGHMTALAPALLGLASLGSVAFASVRLARTLRRLASSSRAGGPSGSVIVGGAEVVLAVVGLRHPRVLISAGALLQLEDDELAAALAHERAHIARRHRYLLAYAEICAAIARVIPGSRAAADELAFHLERDADRSALAGPVDRRALAAALRKASNVSGGEMVLALGGWHVEDRLEEILDGGLRAAPARRSFLCQGVAALLVALVIGVGASVPSAVAAGLDHPHGTGVAVDCD
jgi:Zn-dependent protease with chaperone function